MEVVEIIRSHALALPPLGKFALSMVLIFGIPPLSRRIRLPAVVGLLLSGIVMGPHVLGAFGEDRPIADFLANLGKLLLMFVAGLDMDFTGKPFGQMPFLLAKADYVTKLHAICVRCGNIANYSYRKIPNEDQVMLGAKDVYEPRCRKCYKEV